MTCDARLRIARLLLAILLCIANSGVSIAYDVPLTPAALHEAFILGQRNDAATAAFLNPYVKQITENSQEPHIAEIQILTPFAQVVDLSRRFTSGYSEEQAAREYHQRGDIVVVRIVLMLPAAYPKPEAPANEAPVPSNRTRQAPPCNPRISGRIFVSPPSNTARQSPRVSSETRPSTPRQPRTLLPCWMAPQSGLNTTRKM